MRLIDADELKKAIAPNREIGSNAVCDVLDIIDNAPTVEGSPPGYWSILWDVYCVCSVCQGKQIKFSDYCPDCGARMKEIKE